MQEKSDIRTEKIARRRAPGRARLASVEGDERRSRAEMAGAATTRGKQGGEKQGK